MNDTSMNCRQCEELLFEYHEGSLDPAGSARVSRHLEGCDACSQLLNDIWQMGLVSTRWQDQAIARGDQNQWRNRSTGWQFPNMLATAASLLAIVMVLTGARVTTTDNGIALSMGGDYVTTQQFDAFASRQDQGMKDLVARQVASDQLVLRSVIETSREERKEDLSMLVSYLSASQAKQYQQTEDNMRYLLASQAEDERDIKQLSEAFQRISLGRGNNM